MSSATDLQPSKEDELLLQSSKKVCPYVAQWFTVWQCVVKVLELVSGCVAVTSPRRGTLSLFFFQKATAPNQP